ncbi:Protein of unknown function DUF2612 [uncultured Caudovirales phage]|uniref:DUF2612 domain-containing protein n=1 Tax=uncultured Caudovirales phage TaxID=2100421 RepID=A0A6J5MTH3_9CAUD|nr:Protein of unknown function DUF2612 [uncultured Caudovirales phage]
MTLIQYLNLITSQHRDKPKFLATVDLNTAVQRRVQDLLASMPEKFDVDNAVGQQLDVIGQWVGISRNVAIPVDGVYFSWDGSEFVGWEFGVWQDNLQPATISTLPDDVYRTLIRAKIAANRWDGTTEGAYEVWDAVFPNLTILIQDNQNMSYGLIIQGGIIDSLTLALLTGGYIPLKPEGVRVTNYYVPVDTGPVFGWDVESDFIGGWDEASWTREIAPD